MSKKITKSIEIGGRTLSLTTGELAPQADAAVLARYGDTMILATVVSSQARPDLGYFPLSVEYIERLYAGGRIKGSRFVKREGRPSDEAVLVARLIDRSIRPLFPKGYMNETQIVITVLSVDMENDPDVLSAVATSAVLAISSIPWEGPLGMVRVGFKDGSYFVNPVNGELIYSDLELVVSATDKRCVMLEAGAKEVTEEVMAGAIAFGQKESLKIIEAINEFAKEVGKEKQSFVSPEVNAELGKKILEIVGLDNKDLTAKEAVKKVGSEAYEELKLSLIEQLAEEKGSDISLAMEEIFKQEFRKRILNKERIDGRKIDEIRPISCEVGILPRTHGSAVFSRGETQVLNVATLGSPSLGQLIESPIGEETKRFIHHYSMPPFSTGETGRVGFSSRREIGHGALAEKALLPVIPSEDKFPYTIRLVSEVLSSNGSTSQASICSSTLSLMDAGVPISAPVAGIALGLIEEGDKFVILTDIMGLEDAYGEMDFKVAGTEKGITAIQLDVKNHGLTEEMVKESLEKGLAARKFILEKMKTVLPESRAKVSTYAPKVVVIHVPPEKIGEVIGPGGKMIRKIIEETKATVDIQDDGSVNISAPEEEAVEKAVKWVEGLTTEVKPGEIYEGEVKRIQPFGAFVEVKPGKDGLVHVSKMAQGFVSDPADVVSLGQKVTVRVTEIDDQGRINLSMILDEKDEPQPSERPQRSGFRPNDRFGRRPGGFSRPQSRPRKPRF